MADWPKMLAQATALVRRIVPELASTPIYVVGQKGTPFDQSKACAWTCPRLDILLRDHLEEWWRGRGIGIVVNTELLEQSTPDWNLPTVLAGLVIHEVSHSLVDLNSWGLRNHLLPEDFQPERIESLTNLVKDHVTKELWADDAGDVSSAEFYGHDEKWIRVCCHLAYRVQAMGIYMPEIVVIGKRPEQSLPSSYAWCLDGEPERMATLAMAKILEKPLPPRFAAIWKEDCESFEAARRVSGLK